MTPTEVIGKNGDVYSLRKANFQDTAECQAYVELITDIEGVSVNESYFLPQGKIDFKREHLSFVIFKNGRPVCLLVGYFRLSDDSLPMDSVYIHRLVTSREERRNGLAEHLLHFAIDYYYQNLSWLQNISIQVTAKPVNIAASSLYSKVGFKLFGEKVYPNKIDKILIYRRVQNTSKLACYEDLFTNPRLTDESSGKSRDLTFYFSTSSKEKKQQFKWLFSLYNLKLDFYDLGSELIEPQVDNIPGQSLELLVRYPLKNAARFINKVPFFVEDTSLYIEEFNSDFDNAPELPGQDTKRWWRQLKNEGVLKLLGNSKKRKARYVSLIGCFFGPGSYVVGKSEINGRIADEAKSSENSEQRFPKTNPWFFHQIFIPEGYSKQLSLLNQQDFTIIDYRRKALEDLLVNVKQEIIKSGEQTEINFNG